MFESYLGNFLGSIFGCTSLQILHDYFTFVGTTKPPIKNTTLPLTSSTATTSNLPLTSPTGLEDIKKVPFLGLDLTSSEAEIALYVLFVLCLLAILGFAGSLCAYKKAKNMWKKSTF